MKLALQTDYALRTLMYLASISRRSTASAVASFYGVSQPHVAKVVNQLARLGFVRSIRGVGGGIELARSPEKVPIGEVIEAFEGGLHLLDCVTAEDEICVIQPFCKLRSVMGEAERLQREYLWSVTLADVVPKPRELSQVTHKT